MSALRMAFNELRRITSGKLPKLAVLALALVPLLYASLYLYANKDPYANLNNVPAALVVKDKGTQDLNAGKDVADELLNGRKFNWKVVEDADEGVRKGDYIFALTLPEDFSEALTSAEQNKPRQGVLTLTTNDANNYLGSTIANQVVNEVRRAVTAKVSTEAADKLLLGFSTIRQETTKAADGAKKVADGNATLRDKITELDTGVQKLAPGAAQLSNGLHELRPQTAQLPDATKKLADGARQVATGNETAATEAETYAKKAQELVGGLDQFNGDLATRLRALGFTEEQVQRVLTTLGQVRKPVDDANAKVQGAAGDLRKLANGADQVADGAEQLSAKMPPLAAGVAKLDDGATALNAGLQQAATATPQLKDGATQLATGAAELSTGLSGGVDKIPNQDDPTRAAIAQAIGDPVAVRGLSQTKAATYGAGLAPFFLGLATWIGAFVLFLLLRPLSRRALAAGQSALRVALGGWLPGALLGIVQVLVMFTVVRFVVDIEPSNPLGTFGFLALMSLTFVAILHALNAAFGAVGKFLGLILLILQLVSAGGTFPWQTIPVPLYPLHYGLPMGYAVDGLRHLMYGGDLGSVGKDALILLAWLVGALALSSVAAYKQRVWTVSKLKPELVL
ncbi:MULTISPECIES: YhgE/Pip domain-containing protein [Lentzea]|uniref:Putative membrane protein n=1 Tax=Lentzea albida TaxID=65499 RepID=A0A1H9VRB5_9PSEU|nr:MULTISPECIES: YhgE/Pip domain-containing protein [Lentzea]USX51885.1 YhgE/Pip domain-containing protein [Lentzea sp. HUAS12]SES24081.1 putative membrane protein [Lentzea albida]